jgi:MarR family transcriptional regulator, organic hydroperoxide resistance regulator
MRADPVAVTEIQRCYPQIYLACHTRHVRASSTPHRLSANDSSMLVHLSPTHPTTAGELAAHMGVRASTLSAAVSRLAELGYLRREQSARDKRAAALTLTDQGASAMAETSVLDRDRLAALTALLTDDERDRAIDGLRLLAEASRRLRLQTNQRSQKNGSHQKNRSRPKRRA